MIRCTPHSFSVWIAAADVPPVAMMGSSRMAREGAAEFVEDESEGEW
jgi:hypothetical protein